MWQQVVVREMLHFYLLKWADEDKLNEMSLAKFSIAIYFIYFAFLFVLQVERLATLLTPCATT